jgi:hypothetical protein
MNGLPYQDAELKAKGGGTPLKTLQNLGCEKYAMAKITRVNTVTHKMNCYSCFVTGSEYHMTSVIPGGL